MRLVLATKREVDMSERRLLFMMKPEQLEAFLRLQRAAERGDGAAACRLGDMYHEGLGGLRYSPKETYRWYARSALAGDANGQNNLGACCEHGLGCVQSYVKAVKWYRLAAAQGLAYASSNLGYCYWRGHGVGMDQGAALAWFERALEQGDDRAKEMVEQLGGAVSPKRRVRFVDKTVPGKNFGIVGIGGVARPDGDASESGDTEDSQ
jgi:TPR repeat protein